MANDAKRHEEKLPELREQIAEVDRALLELLRRRMELAADVGRIKAGAGQQILVPDVHDQVLTRARQHADECGVSTGVLEAIFDAVMRGSIERQHRVGVALRAEVGSRLLILGGAGNMGGWFHRFSKLLGHRVDLVDPAIAPLPPATGRFGSLADIPDLDVYDAIIVSTPLRTTPAHLEELIAARPRGLVIEIASIKDHLRSALDKGRDAGVRISSLHPMFGPGKSPYESLTFVVAFRDDPREETLRIEGWLRHPYTHLVQVPFDHHDRLMGWLLGLGHLSGMLFGCALTHAGLGIEELDACASTTYNRQAATALSVLLEDPDLYFDIQQLNPHRTKVYQAVRESLDKLVGAVESGDREDFREFMANARRILDRKR